MSTCNRLGLQTLGPQLIMLKNLPDHCRGDYRSKSHECLKVSKSGHLSGFSLLIRGMFLRFL